MASATRPPARLTTTWPRERHCVLILAFEDVCLRKEIPASAMNEPEELARQVQRMREQLLRVLVADSPPGARQ